MLISPEYQEQQEQLHAVGNYGVTGQKYAPMVSEIIDTLQIDHLLDYGCGSNLSLLKSLELKRKCHFQAYDPGFARYAEPPVAAEMVACCDVLEHIEPEFLDNVLDHLADLTQMVIFLSVHMGPAGKTLSDGRNAHLTQMPMEWWLPKLWERFSIQTVQVTGPMEFFVIAHPLNAKMPDNGLVSLIDTPIVG